MHVLMLGWEFPPFITGGLGTACHGLTRAMDQRGMRVTFVLPQAVSGEQAGHVDLVSPQTHRPPTTEAPPASASRIGPSAPRPSGTGDAARPAGESREGFDHVRFIPVDSGFVQPYEVDAGGRPVGRWETGPGRAPDDAPASAPSPTADDAGQSGTTESAGAPTFPDDPDLPRPPPSSDDYGNDLIAQVERYAAFCLDAVGHLDFDVIHAHDWMTYAAGLWIARASGRPLVVHVHSTEFDRSGERVNQRIYDIERRGMHGAMRVITVSQLTKDVVVSRYGVPDSHVEVVYNGVDLDLAEVGLSGIQQKDKIVLYFGRITYQKGPEYFVRAAKRVLEHLEDVKFVVAGSGDLARSMIEMAAHLGIGHKVLFTGFLRGDDIKKVFALADLYVMPSISEPFGIAPLEAMGHDVPVLISRTSGVSEVLQHALKVDFWDVDDMANKIIAVLRHPPLSQTLREHGRFEVRQLTWDGAAQRCEEIYRDVIAKMSRPARAR
jgi:glycosyltransferase involved in cell wall biosynthesis